MGSKVPKFGAWEGVQGNENFTVYFDNARKTKNGQKINPNDPEENPELFGGSAQAPPPPAQARAPAHARAPAQAPAQAQTRVDEQRSRKTRQGGPSVTINEPQAQARVEIKEPRPKGGPLAQEGRAKVPQFGAWNGGEGAQYTAYFDNARKNKNEGGEPMMNRDVGDRGRAPPATKVRAESSKDDVMKNASRGGSISSLPSSEGLAKQGSVPKENPKVNHQARTGGGRANQAAAGVPQFGGWNNDPSQAEGYTVAFARAKEDRKTPLHNNASQSDQQPPRHNNQKQASCCSIL